MSRSSLDPYSIEQMKRLQEINEKLSDEEKLIPKGIENMLELLRRKPMCADLIDIVNKKGEILGQLDVRWAHRLGLGHQTANAFIVTKTGRLILQRRVHNTRFPLYLSIPGGHLKVSQSYEEGIRSEISEELNLPGPPRGKLTELDRDFYSEVGDRNVEHRALYLYQLTLEEEEWVKTFSRTLEMKKSELTREAYKAFLKREQKKPGNGEVWGIYEVDVNQLEQAKTSEAHIEELGITANLHYIPLTDRFKDGEVTEKAYFTPDLLERIVNNPDMMQKLKSQINLAKEFSQTGDQTMFFPRKVLLFGFGKWSQEKYYPILRVLHDRGLINLTVIDRFSQRPQNLSGTIPYVPWQEWVQQRNKECQIAFVVCASKEHFSVCSELVKIQSLLTLICEKPFGVKLEEARAIYHAALAREISVIVCDHYLLRSEATAVDVATIRSIGPMVKVTARINEKTAEGPHIGVGVILDLLVHLINLLHVLFEPGRISIEDALIVHAESGDYSIRVWAVGHYHWSDHGVFEVELEAGKEMPFDQKEIKMVGVSGEILMDLLAHRLTIKRDGEEVEEKQCEQGWNYSALILLLIFSS